MWIDLLREEAVGIGVAFFKPANGLAATPRLWLVGRWAAGVIVALSRATLWHLGRHSARPPVPPITNW